MIETEFVVSAHSAKHHTLCCHKHRTLGDSVSQHQVMRVFFATHPQQTNLTQLRKEKNFTLHIKYSRCQTIHHKIRLHRLLLHRHLAWPHQCLSPTTKQQTAAPHLQTYHSPCPLQLFSLISLAMLVPHLQQREASRRTRS